MPLSHGGVADYACFQANALVNHGIDVTMLTPPNFQEATPLECDWRPILLPIVKDEFRSSLSRLNDYLKVQGANHRILSEMAVTEKFSHVLMGCFAEYFSPFWISYLKKIRRHGLRIGSIIHDPVRHFVVGPKIWHRYCIRTVYRQTDYAFVHEEITLDKGGLESKLPVIVLPYGPNALPDATRSRDEIRKIYEIPTDAKVFLAFGHLRDEKNIDLIIRALPEIHGAYLIVVGDENSRSQKAASYYQALAQELGVADRCRWDIRYVRGSEVGDLFSMADYCAFTYKASFRSASSALNTAAYYRKPVIASSGAGPMKTTVERYKLGVWVQPDNLNVLVKGINELIREDVFPNWDGYIEDNSWSKNASLLAGEMEL